MTGGIQKWALIAYVVLCVYLLSQPSPQKLTERAQAMDQRFHKETAPGLSQAMALALEMQVNAVDCFLNEQNAKPSGLVFTKLLDQCGRSAGEDDPAAVILRSGMPMDQALAYFDSVEKRVTDQLSKMHTLSAHASKIPVKEGYVSSARGPAHGSLSVRSRPD